MAQIHEDYDFTLKINKTEYMIFHKQIKPQYGFIKITFTSKKTVEIIKNGT